MGAVATVAWHASCVLALCALTSCQEDQQALDCLASDGSCKAEGGASSSDGAQAPSRQPHGYYWAQQKGDPARTGWASYSVSFNLSAGPWWSWNDPHKDVIRATPLIDDELNVYLCTIAGRVHKFKSDGTLMWTHNAEQKLPHAPSLYNGVLYLATENGWLIALDMESGRARWMVQVAARISNDPSSILASDGLIIFGAVLQDKLSQSPRGNTAVVAASAESGEVKWQFTPNAPTYNLQVAAPGDGTIIFQDQAGAVYRLHLADGSLMWRSGARDRFDFTSGASVVFDGRVFVASNLASSTDGGELGMLQVYRLTDGQLLWIQVLPHLANQAVAIGRLAGSRDRVSAVIGTGKKPSTNISASGSAMLSSILGPATARSLRWHLMTLFPSWFAAEEASAVLAFDAETGELQWRYDLAPRYKPAADGDLELIRERIFKIENGANPHNDPSCSPDLVSQPVVDGNGTTFIAFHDGRIYAIRDANSDGHIDSEQEVSSAYLGAAQQGPPALAPGMLVAASCAGGLHVFKL